MIYKEKVELPGICFELYIIWVITKMQTYLCDENKRDIQSRGENNPFILEILVFTV